MPSAVPLVRAVRSGFEESVHRGHVAVCDAEGRLIASAGDPERPVFARSSMKPLQACVSHSRLETELSSELLAISCASHNGEAEHVRAVRKLLRATGVSSTALRCPPDLPSRREDAIRITGPARIFHNCSGKHSAMLGACAAQGWELETYRDPRHPLQRAIVRAVRAGTDVERPAIGVDGCGAPVFGMPLRAMATLFARLTRPERLGRFGPLAGRAVAAMREHPSLVAGTGRTDTALMREVPGVVSKVGAEALFCAGVLEPGFGVAVKIEDGGDRAAGPALIHALGLLGAIDDRQLEALGPVARKALLGGGVEVGALVPGFTLRRARA
jgi:L-asparaginase II